MSMRKLIAILCVFVLTVGIFGGCASDDEQPSSSNSEKKSDTKSESKGEEKPYELSFLFLGDDAAKSVNADNDRVVKEMSERLGVTFQFRSVPEGGYEKINIAIASGDLPDVVNSSYPNAAVSQWIRDGVILPINDYFDIMPTVKEQCERESWTAVDGQYYGYPFIAQKGITNSNIVVRGDWMEELGIEEPQTLDEFHDMLLKFRADKDTYGISGAKPIGNFAWVFHAYGLEYADWSLDVDSNVIPKFEDPSFKLGMEYLKTLWDEDLIDKEFMLNDNKMKEEKWYQGKVAVVDLPLYRHVSRHEGNLQKVDPNGKLTYIAPPAGPEGNRGFAGEGKSGMLTAITAACEQPEKAAAFIELLVSPEGRDLLTLGIEGVHYTKDGDTINYNLEEREKDNFASNGWSHFLAWGTVTWPLASNYLPQIEPNRERALDSVDFASQYQMGNLVPLKTESEIEFKGLLDEIYNEKFIMMLTGEVTIDEGITSLSEEWRDQGGDQVLAEVQKIYDSLK
ncbi:extracellular solute-binding protein [Vallitalea okinawensis]|uniref:extracellular solute-binding protein n=1 Tax=Vallitalea okinawensis TaxID=2078660 RepID=UPI0013007F0B|nr:extracellular solute-binding protein [Vallitalea okinawensis]